MRYTEFRDVIRRDLERIPGGLTWKELRERNGLPYRSPCPEWLKSLEKDIGLRREKKRGRSYIWQLSDFL